MQIEIDGILIRITQKNVKNLRISVNTRDESVKVSVPLSCSNYYIESFVISKLEWIKKQIKKSCKRTLILQNDYSDSGKVNIFGEYYTVDLVVSDKESFFISNGIAKICVSDLSRYSAAIGERIYYRYITSIFRIKAEEYFEKYRLISGLEYSSLTVRDMKTRWGSCNTVTHRITLNLRLTFYPERCLEYVVLHELIHTKIPGHGKDFYDEMSKYIPEWKSIRKILNG